MAEPIEPITLTAATTGSPAATWSALTDPVLVVEWFTEATPVGPIGAPYRLDFGDGSVVNGTIRAGGWPTAGHGRKPNRSRRRS